METIDDLLSRHPFFTGLKPEHLALIAGCGQNVHVKAGTYLLREGEAADRFFAIRGGSVAVETYVPSRGPVTLQTLGEGEILGWSWLIKPYRWTYEAVATEPVRAIEFHADCIRPYLDEEPAAGYELVTRIAGVMAERLQSAGLRLIDIYGVHDDH